jgi:hypothetical protein
MLALCSIGVHGRVVIVPALTCVAVPLAVLAAGGSPRLVDVSPADGNLDLGATAAALDGDVAAIVAVDGFGYPAPVDALRALAGPYGCPVLEDACQAYGGRAAGGAPAGTLGDVGVISFGYAKNVWLNAGGLVLTDDAATAGDIVALQRAPDYALLSAVRSRTTLRLVVTNREALLPYLARWLGQLRYGFPAAQRERLPDAWRTFVAELDESRSALVEVVETLARFPGAQPFGPVAGDWLPWRPSVRIADDEVRHAFVATLAAAGVVATRLFPVIGSPYVGRGSQPCPEAHRIAAAIVNVKTSARAAATAQLAETLSHTLGAIA